MDLTMLNFCIIDYFKLKKHKYISFVDDYEFKKSLVCIIKYFNYLIAMHKPCIINKNERNTAVNAQTIINNSIEVFL